MAKKDMNKYVFKRGKEKKSSCDYHKHCGGFYFLGFIGSAVYFLQNSSGFWATILALLKAAVWPAFLVYKLFGM